MEQITFAKGAKELHLCSNMLNRHGVIAGATGTGKTVTLKVLAEKFSDQGIPVFLSDVKGDLSGLAKAGEMNDKLAQRIASLGLSDFEFASYPVEFWDIFGEMGLPMRTTVSQMGPLMFSRLLGLNEVQEGIMNIVFKVADDEGLLLIDLKDLRAMINYVETNAKDLSSYYGNIAKQSTGAILRSLLVLEQQGAVHFFGEPDFQIEDFFTPNDSGKGKIHLLSSERLFQSPKLYSTYLFWLLSEIYESLPEVGDVDKPKFVFFFDEAHLLFDDTNQLLIDKIELVVRLIRSKGVGVFFITQNPTDIPDKVSSQLGNRVQHALRAFSPKEQKNVKAVSEIFRQDGSFSVEQAITELQVGEALISTLDEKGIPTFVQCATIYPPKSALGVLDPVDRMARINRSALQDKYAELVDNVSAYEQLSEKEAAKLQEMATLEAEKAQQLEEEKQRKLQEQEALRTQKEADRQALQAQKEAERQALQAQKEAERQALQAQREAEKAAKAQAAPSARRTDSNFDRFTKNVMSSVGRELGRQIMRGIFGTRK